MTEGEAKTKYCCSPMAVASGLMRLNTIGVAGEGGVWLRCQGSACMAWRWRLQYLPPATPEGVLVALGPLETTISTTDGFCGLAGAPP